MDATVHEWSQRTASRSQFFSSNSESQALNSDLAASTFTLSPLSSPSSMLTVSFYTWRSKDCIYLFIFYVCGEYMITTERLAELCFFLRTRWVPGGRDSGWKHHYSTSNLPSPNTQDFSCDGGQFIFFFVPCFWCLVHRPTVNYIIKSSTMVLLKITFTVLALHFRAWSISS